MKQGDQFKTEVEKPKKEGFDGKTWREWYDRHANRLFLFARQQSRSEQDAQDVLQDAILRLWKSGLTHESESGVLEPSLPAAFMQIRRSAIDLARKNIRRANREQKAVLLEENDNVVWFESRLESDERVREIERSLKSLPDYYKEVIMLKIWGELTFEQIAETLDIPMNTAASRYRYALQKLRRTLKPSRVA